MNKKIHTLFVIGLTLLASCGGPTEREHLVKVTYTDSSIDTLLIHSQYLTVSSKGCMYSNRGNIACGVRYFEVLKTR